MCNKRAVWIFVYGTLKYGGKLYTGWEEYRTEDSITGMSMYTRGGVPYPFGKLDGSVNKVKGELHLIPEEKLQWLDHMEGCMYVRKNAITDRGIPCQVYDFLGTPEMYNLKLSENGEFDQYA